MLSKRKSLLILAFVFCFFLIPRQAMAMQIYVQSGTGTSTFTLDVEPSDTIENVKTKIQDQEGISPDGQVLTYNGIFLNDGNVLSDYSITNHAIINLTNLIAYWNMDESSGDAHDSSGSNLNLTNQGGVGRAQGVFGNAAVFDGTDNFAGTGPNLASSSFSISGWVNADNFSGTMIWLSMGSVSTTNNALHLRVYDNGNMLMGFFLNDLQASGFTNNAWHHVVYNYNVNTGARQIYLDDQLIASDTASPFMGDTSMAIGDWNTFEHWQGMIDDVRIYNGSLPQAEIDSLYQAGEASLAQLAASTGGCGTMFNTVGNITYQIRCGITTVYSVSTPSTTSLSSTAAAPIVLTGGEPQAMFSGAFSGLSSAVAAASSATSSVSLASTSVSMPTIATPSVAIATTSAATSTAIVASTQVATTTLAASQATSSNPVPAPAAYIFDTNLSLGSTGTDVYQLQKYLNSHGYPVATSGPGSVGNETTLFGAKTKTTLVKFQKVSGLSASGFFGPLTRAFINAH